MSDTPHAVLEGGHVRVLPDDPYNQALVENAHPPGWVNPVPKDRYHLVVIGAGTAGLVAATGAAALGADVALVEKHLMGGDCLNVGCVPSKALIRAARAAAEVRAARRFGVEIPDKVQIDFARVMQRMRRLRAEISPQDSAARFRDLGVDVFFGEGRFVDGKRVDVDGQTLRFKKAVIATGSRPAEPPIPGLAETGYLTNETVFALSELPRRLAVIGAGPVGCELSQALARFGSQVTLLEAGRGILAREDRQAAAVLERAMVRDGVRIVTQCRITRIESHREEKVLHFQCDGTTTDLVADEILVGAGRVPNVEGLDLEAAGVEFDTTGGVKVDDRLRTTNHRIFAAGDVCSRFKFTHAADFMARTVIRNALFLGHGRASALTIPWCTYTSPEVAHVGLYEHQAKDEGFEVDTYVQELAEVDRAVLDGQSEGFVKVHVIAGSDRIVGATIVAEHAGDMISELTLAIAGNFGLGRLADVIHPYPTQAEAIRKLGDAYNRTRLTARVKGLLEKWLAWTR
ncbi:MAG TPA: mercuric reductase [Thermoguttaceae bacterium]|nr:mercuric reductase [Thermoguttaceae bacterium]